MRKVRFKVTTNGGKKTVMLCGQSIATIKISMPRRSWHLNFHKNPNLITAGKGTVLDSPEKIRRVLVVLFRHYNWNTINEGWVYAVIGPGKSVVFEELMAIV